MKKKLLVHFLRIFISLGLIGYFLYTLAQEQGGLKLAFQTFARAFIHTSIPWLIPAFLLHLLGFSLLSLRWQILLRPQGVNARFNQLFHYYFMAAFFNTILPSTVGGDAMRAIESRKLTGQAATSIVVIVIERLSGMLALGVIAGTALVMKIFSNQGQGAASWGFVLAIFGGFLLLILATHPRLAPKILHFSGKILPQRLQALLDQAYRAVAVYYRHPGSLVSSFAISIVFQFNMVVYYYLIARALHQNPEPLDFLVKAPILVFLLMTVPAINGIGVRTYVFTQLMKFPKAIGLSAEAIDLGFKYIYGLLGGIMFLLYRRTPRGDRRPG